MIPPGISGKVMWIAPAGEYSINEIMIGLQTAEGERNLTMVQNWPVRRARPYQQRLLPSVPLITGQRVIDTFFPLAKGGAAAIPGGFGAGKTVMQHQLAKWSDADIIVYIGCGERGNEMTEVLEEFPELIDPHSGHPLMERTILIANTSNMPVAAREASVYTGITLAEYYRDMGYHVALMADSTSRWAEALREISGRLEEMPAEEGFPAYLPARLAEFYERAGHVVTIGDREGSVSIVGAVSPPGGDFSDPVVQHTKRFIRCFWALDKDLANARHFPSVNWLDSYSEYLGMIGRWWDEQGKPDWRALRSEAMDVLHRESGLQQIVRLVGADALPDEERLILEAARLLREGYLQQSALDEVDTYATMDKQLRMLSLIMRFYRRAKKVIECHCPVFQIRQLPVISELLRMKYVVSNDQLSKLDEIEKLIDQQVGALERGLLPMTLPSPNKALLEAHGAGGQEILGLDQVEGPLIVVRGAHRVAYDEMVEIITPDGRSVRGRVLEVGGDVAVIEVFASTSGLSIPETRVRFLGRPLEIPVAVEMLGRVFNGLGEPIDGQPPVLPERWADINGSPINPTVRVYPRQSIETGIAAIDGMNTLLRGQKLPIFSGSGLPHDQLAAQLARQARLRGADKEDRFAIVFAAMGVRHDVAAYFQESFAQSGALINVAMFLNLADDPPIERLITPRAALTLAEHLAFQHEMHVLVILTDMTNYCEALRQLSSARNEIPGRKGYPGYLYSDLSSLYERTGRIRGLGGSITQVPILTMPNDDITHPIPDLTAYITEGQIVLSRDPLSGGYLPADCCLAQSFSPDERWHRRRAHAR